MTGYHVTPKERAQARRSALSLALQAIQDAANWAKQDGDDVGPYDALESAVRVLQEDLAERSRR
jgi:hypothetical protein